jgi:hypothetical protein
MLALLVASTASLEAAPRQPAGPPPVSLERIREGLKTPPAIDVNVPVQAPVATFKTRVEQRVYVLTFDAWLRKEFRLTALQRQSAEWGSRCCGLNVLGLVKSVKNARQRGEARKIREQIAGDLAQIEAARKK